MHEGDRFNNYLSKHVVSTFRYVSQSCPKRHWCLLLGNINGIASDPVLKFKAQPLNELKQEYSFDGPAFYEVELNMSASKPYKSLPLLVNISDICPSVAAHNIHKNIGRAQQGGCFIMVFGEPCQYFKKTKGGSDP